MTAAKRNGQFLPAIENFGEDDPELRDGLELESLEAADDKTDEGPSSASRLQGDLMRLLRNATSGTEIPLLWLIGDRLRRDLVAASDASQGRKILTGVAAGMAKFSPEWDEERILFGLGIAEDFPDLDHVSRLSEKLNEAHFLQILTLHDDQSRCLFAELAALENWDPARLAAEIASGDRLRQSGIQPE